MKNTDFWIRDPFVLLDGGKYYVYGTTRPRENHGFDLYTSDDLVNFDGPFEVFDYFDGFWGKMHYWAPEVHKYRGKYYMFATFKDDGPWHGCQILCADTPMGPFKPHSEGPITPKEWSSLDGTFYVDKNGTPFMIFCHEWLQNWNGTVEAIRLKDNFSGTFGERKLLFRAFDSPWSRDYDENGKEIPNKVTDGPYVFRTQTGKLGMIWTSWVHDRYTQGVAYSTSGKLEGPWVQKPEPITPPNYGHGMIFRTFDGKLLLCCHSH